MAANEEDEHGELPVTVVAICGDATMRLSVIPALLGKGWTPERVAVELTWNGPGLIVPVYTDYAITVIEGPTGGTPVIIAHLVDYVEDGYPHKWRDILVATAIAATLAYLLVNYISSY